MDMALDNAHELFRIFLWVFQGFLDDSNALETPFLSNTKDFDQLSMRFLPFYASSRIWVISVNFLKFFERFLGTEMRFEKTWKRNIFSKFDN